MACSSRNTVSVLFNEPKLLKSWSGLGGGGEQQVSVLFNEPKLLKFLLFIRSVVTPRAVSVLFNEPKLLKFFAIRRQQQQRAGFSALQRAEIAEMKSRSAGQHASRRVSVLFNEPKLLKSP